MYDTSPLSPACATKPSSIVIVGGGQSGAWAAKTLRDQGYAGAVTLVCDELHSPYERPALSKAVLSRSAEPHTTQVFAADVLESLALHWRRGIRVESLDRPSKRLFLSDGSELVYDKLIFCTGGRALRPRIPGIDLAGVHTLRTLDDCQYLGEAMRRSRSVCVIGGGWIGLEVASAAVGMGKAVTLLERSTRLCERALPAEVSAHVLDVHLAAGVDVRLGMEVEALERSGAGLCVVSANAATVRADIVVIGAGLVANDEVASKAGLLCDHGIAVDTRCSTSDPDILAAGDVALAPNQWAGRRVRLESWQNATDQAVVAAKACLGIEAAYDPLPWFWSDQHGVNIQIYGWPGAKGLIVTRPVKAPGSFVTFLLEEDRIVGAVAVNAARELRMSRKLIEDRRIVRPAELADPAFKLSSL